MSGFVAELQKNFLNAANSERQYAERSSGMRHQWRSTAMQTAAEAGGHT